MELALYHLIRLFLHSEATIKMMVLWTPLRDTALSLTNGILFNLNLEIQSMILLLFQLEVEESLYLAAKSKTVNQILIGKYMTLQVNVLLRMQIKLNLRVERYTFRQFLIQMPISCTSSRATETHRFSMKAFKLTT